MNVKMYSPNICCTQIIYSKSNQRPLIRTKMVVYLPQKTPHWKEYSVKFMCDSHAYIFSDTLPFPIYYTFNIRYKFDNNFVIARDNLPGKKKIKLQSPK